MPHHQHHGPGALALIVLLTALLPGRPLHGQAIERSWLLEPPASGLPWQLDVAPQFRFDGGGPAGRVRLRTTFDLALGLPGRGVAGGRYTPESSTVPGRPGEWELWGRWAPLADGTNAPVDLAVQAGYNAAATSVDAELGLARWFGGVRLLGAGRVLGDAYGLGSTRAALAGGVVVFPHPRGMPISLSADAATLVDRRADERVAWSVAINAGVSYSPHTIALFATNTPSGSLQGRSIGRSRTRWGVAFTAPVVLGRLLGVTTSRETAARAVAADAAPAADMVRADIFGYRYPQYRLEIRRGTTVEWTNRDAMMHTVSADDGSWGSGAIQPGESWRARFDEPGTYPFHCGPHPFMRGVVIVR
jgi:plastocyanin